MKFHPLADIFPMIEGVEFNSLIEDIKINGLREPVYIYEDKILDGRNRWNACQKAGIEPKTKEYKGNDPLSFVISMNLKRRHLSESQRAVVASKLANMNLGDNREMHRPEKGSANLPILKIGTISQPEAARLMNVGERSIRDVKEIERKAPEKIKEIERGNKTIHEVKKEIRGNEIKKERNKIADKAMMLPVSEKINIEQGDIKTYKPKIEFDFILTDPPYPEEYLPLYEILAKRANDFLKDGGLLMVMCGQSYLNNIYATMSKHMTYYWTACYLTPGQPTPLRTRQVNTTWKPILMFTKKDNKYKGKIFGDVFKSDGNDKSFHKWGQSESGMLSIISSVCLPGESIFDPFCGAGATGVAAVQYGCIFHGIDIEMESVNISKGRINDATKKR